jgi:hypothetical protein
MNHPERKVGNADHPDHSGRFASACGKAGGKQSLNEAILEESQETQHGHDPGQNDQLIPERGDGRRAPDEAGPDEISQARKNKEKA